MGGRPPGRLDENGAGIAYADFRAIRASDGFVLSHLTGSRALDPSQVTFGMNSTAVQNVLVLVFGGGGMQGITFNVNWTKSGEPTAVNSTDGGHTVTQSIPTTIGGTASMPIFNPSTGRVETFTFGADSVTAWSLNRVLVDSN
jgi:hypothetical protein